MKKTTIKKPVKKIPDLLYSDFSMGGECLIEYRYINNASKKIQRQINKNFSKEIFNTYLEMAEKRELNYYGKTDKWLYEALTKYSILNKEILIYGSANPWYEAISLEFKAKKITVLEYSERPSFHNKIEYMKPTEQIGEFFDVAFSISSFEHDGLGRYGDPINPNADIEAMQNAKRRIKTGGLLFLSIPVGKDKVCFNVHRIYGKHRLPLLFNSWKLMDSFGFNEHDIDNEINNVEGTPYQPIFVLKNL